MITYTQMGLVDYIVHEYRLFAGRLMDAYDHVTIAQSSSIVLGKIRRDLCDHCSAYTYRAVNRDGVSVMLDIQRQGESYRLEERAYEKRWK